MFSQDQSTSWLFLLSHYRPGPADSPLAYHPAALQPPSDCQCLALNKAVVGYSYDTWLSSIIPHLPTDCEEGTGLILVCRSCCLMQQEYPAEQPLSAVLPLTFLPVIPSSHTLSCPLWTPRKTNQKTDFTDEVMQCGGKAAFQLDVVCSSLCRTAGWLGGPGR